MFSRIKAFLSERAQQAVVDGAKLNVALVTTGVPQGRVFRPILLIFIKDLPNKLHPRTHLFADDCIVYREISLVKRLPATPG